VIAGAFAENLALFDGLADRDRVVFLLAMLGQKVCVSIEADMVAVAWRGPRLTFGCQPGGPDSPGLR
jgi:hypothetical protein